jgi:hypothetical protein
LSRIATPLRFIATAYAERWAHVEKNEYSGKERMKGKMLYPQRSDTHQLEELSERFFANSLPRNWHHEKPGGDYGVDIKVDIFEDNNATGLELLVQLKSSHDANELDFETINLKTATYNYLWDKVQVVMLVKFVEVENEAYWLLLSDVPEPKQNQDSFTIRVPKPNRLSSIDWQRIQNYVRDVTNGKIATRRRNRFGEY